jgi:alpha-ketoglutarate-dependent taurine dioxygenase
MRLHPTGKFDNQAAETRHIEVRPLAAAMGAEIGGVDVRTMTDDQFEEIRQALFRHKMIYFRGQKLSHADQETFSLRFGAFAEDAYTSGIPGHKDVHPLIKEADDKSKMVFGEGWHTDSPFLSEPPSITILRSVEIPPYGGDTIWANSALAYDMLSDGYKAMIADLKVHFSLRDVLRAAQEAVEERDSPIGRLASSRNSESLSDDLKRKIRGSMHPMVRTHPVTGEKALYVDGAYAVGIEGMTEEEARPILDFLAEYIVQHAFTCRLRWEPDMLVAWDNRLCVHQAFNDYQGFRREMYRTTVSGEVPA